jgi:hypothetical protein
MRRILQRRTSTTSSWRRFRRRRRGRPMHGFDDTLARLHLILAPLKTSRQDA